MSEEKSTKPSGRRGFLKVAVGTVVGVAVGFAGGWFGRAPGAVTEERVVEKVVEKPVEKIVEKIVKVPSGEVPVVGLTAAERALNAAKEIIKRDNIPAGSVINVITAAPVAPTHLEAEVKDLWERETGTKIEVASVPVTELYDKLMLEASAKTGNYDVLHMKPMWTADMVGAGLFADMTDWVRRYDPRMHGRPDGYAYPMDWILTTWAGRYVSLATDNDTMFLMIRKDLLENSREQENFEKQYGYPLKVPETIREYMDQIAFFHRPPDLYGCIENRIGVYYSLPQFLIRFECKKYPATYLFDDDMTPRINTPEGIRAIEEYIGIKSYTHPDVAAWTIGEVYSFMAKGKAYASINYPSMVKTLMNPEASVIADKFLVAVPPGEIVDSPRGKVLLRRNTHGGGWNMGISNFSKYPELAYLYAQFYADPNNLVIASTGKGSWIDPARYNQMEPGADPRQRVTHGPALHVFAEATKNVTPFFPMKGAEEYIAGMAKNLVRAQVGEISASDAANEIAKKYNEITDRIGRDVQKKDWSFIKSLYPPV